MIRYVVRCEEAHKFEAWFRSQEESEHAIASSERLLCPVCEKMAGADVEPAVEPSLTMRHAYQ